MHLISKKGYEDQLNEWWNTKEEQSKILVPSKQKGWYIKVKEKFHLTLNLKTKILVSSQSIFYFLKDYVRNIFLLKKKLPNS